MCRMCLASTSHDATLRLWDLAMLQEEPEEEKEQFEQQVHSHCPAICQCKYLGCMGFTLLGTSTQTRCCECLRPTPVLHQYCYHHQLALLLTLFFGAQTK